LRKTPAYLWTTIALLVGIAAGGTLPHALAPLATGTRAILSFVVRVTPFLVVGALGPAIATLIRRRLAGRFVALVLGWFVLMSTVGSFLGLAMGAVAFRLPFQPPRGSLAGGMRMLRDIGFGGGASVAVLSIAVSVVIGAIGGRSDWVYARLRDVERGIGRAGASVGIAMAPLILALGVMIGVEFGARLGASHYGVVIVWSAAMAVVWWLFYVALILPRVGHVRDPVRLVKEYYLPTALFAAGTCSSLVTIPVNVASLKHYGVRDEVADLVVPLGAIMHKGASAMQYMAYGPLIAGSVFGITLDWLHLLMVWPVVVLYSMAAPGIPGAMGLSLWTGVLFASLLGLDDPLRTSFVGTWVALTGGVPDMFRSSGNATADGFSAIVFNNNFDWFFGDRAVASNTDARVS